MDAESTFAMKVPQEKNKIHYLAWASASPSIPSGSLPEISFTGGGKTPMATKDLLSGQLTCRRHPIVCYKALQWCRHIQGINWLLSLGDTTQQNSLQSKTIFFGEPIPVLELPATICIIQMRVYCHFNMPGLVLDRLTGWEKEGCGAGGPK